MKRAVVIGAGPAGLMAALRMAQAGLAVTICEAKPSVGRKFLMAGKSGLNLTKAESPEIFHAAFAESEVPLRPILEAFDAKAVQEWATALGQTLFTGTTGRVFPQAMKASPLLRAWLGQLADLGVEIHTRWRWLGWEGADLAFDTATGPQTLTADVAVLALGGSSWARLGSDGAWADILGSAGVGLTSFAPANAGLIVPWTDHMVPHVGTALKGIALSSGQYTSRGEAVLSRAGLEGGGVYSVSRGVREGAPLVIDLLPDQPLDVLIAKLSKPRSKATLSTVLRKALKLDPAKAALLREMAHPLPADPNALARLIKGLNIRHGGLAPLDEAISTAGGVAWNALDETLMLNARPGVFVAGEMLDWEAPTGGYLISACLATGAWSGQHAALMAQSARD
ncbi:aminoacetone oxidase family FAD-binding enzyme [Sulfitobacter sp. SK012]|uniref:TIGR03862 family flavoprotein n=1 Tax=Sulfitobacter sp. SK012 TaxID=1389005 RepID=UPI000E0AD011|nr:TIGR03862 family flavoprotein [Sulfitobacter sp. SK012]AXI44892.1 aminoacetone oxidase family FAD-binding enzyme [Sulfitobacter sp. SK012]